MMSAARTGPAQMNAAVNAEMVSIADRSIGVSPLAWSSGPLGKT
jgi:hypothetical protein